MINNTVSKSLLPLDGDVPISRLLQEKLRATPEIGHYIHPKSGQLCLSSLPKELLLADRILSVLASDKQPGDLSCINDLLNTSSKKVEGRAEKSLRELCCASVKDDPSREFDANELSWIKQQVRLLVRNVYAISPYKDQLKATLETQADLRGEAVFVNVVADFKFAISRETDNLTAPEIDFAILGFSALLICRNLGDHSKLTSESLDRVIKQNIKLLANAKIEPFYNAADQFSAAPLQHPLFLKLKSVVSELRDYYAIYKSPIDPIAILARLGTHVATERQKVFHEKCSYANAMVHRHNFERETLLRVNGILQKSLDGQFNTKQLPDNSSVVSSRLITEATFRLAREQHSLLFSSPKTAPLTYIRISEEQNISDLVRPLLSADADLIIIAGALTYECTEAEIEAKYANQHPHALRINYHAENIRRNQVALTQLASVTWIKQAFAWQLEALGATNIFYHPSLDGVENKISFDWSHSGGPAKPRTLIYTDTCKQQKLAQEKGIQLADKVEIIQQQLRDALGRKHSIVVEIPKKNQRDFKLKPILEQADAAFLLPDIDSGKFGEILSYKSKLKPNDQNDKPAKQEEERLEREALHQERLAAVLSSSTNLAQRLELGQLVVKRAISDKNIMQALQVVEVISSAFSHSAGQTSLKSSLQETCSLIFNCVGFQVLINTGAEALSPALIDLIWSNALQDKQLKKRLPELRGRAFSYAKSLSSNKHFVLALSLLRELDDTPIEKWQLAKDYTSKPGAAELWKSCLKSYQDKLKQTENERIQVQLEQQKGELQTGFNKAVSCSANEALLAWLNPYMTAAGVNLPSTIVGAEQYQSRIAECHLAFRQQNLAVLLSRIAGFNRRQKLDFIGTPKSQELLSLGLYCDCLELALSRWGEIFEEWIGQREKDSRLEKPIDGDLLWLNINITAVTEALKNQVVGPLSKLPRLLLTGIKQVDQKDQQLCALNVQMRRLIYIRLTAQVPVNQRAVFEILAEDPQVPYPMLHPLLHQDKQLNKAFEAAHKVIQQEEATKLRLHEEALKNKKIAEYTADVARIIKEGDFTNLGNAKKSALLLQAQGINSIDDVTLTDVLEVIRKAESLNSGA